MAKTLNIFYSTDQTQSKSSCLLQSYIVWLHGKMSK